VSPHEVSLYSICTTFCRSRLLLFQKRSRAPLAVQWHISLTRRWICACVRVCHLSSDLARIIYPRKSVRDTASANRYEILSRVSFATAVCTACPVYSSIYIHSSSAVNTLVNYFHAILLRTCNYIRYIARLSRSC
jgi:hypothetical protein